jgi:hypothetical protein
MKALLFDAALEARGVTKREFSAYSAIPYDTVAGWKKRGVAPDTALPILKTMPIQRKKQTKVLKKEKNNDAIVKNYKIIQAAFWGKNITVDMILTKVKDHDIEYIKPIFDNVFYKDIITLLGVETIIALKPIYKKVMDKQNAEFWEMLARKYKALR